MEVTEASSVLQLLEGLLQQILFEKLKIFPLLRDSILILRIIHFFASKDLLRTMIVNPGSGFKELENSAILT